MEDLIEKKEILSTNCEQFCNALKIHITKPHLLNRRICGSNDVWCANLNADLSNFSMNEFIIGLLQIIHDKSNKETVKASEKENEFYTSEQSLKIDILKDFISNYEFLEENSIIPPSERDEIDSISKENFVKLSHIFDNYIENPNGILLLIRMILPKYTKKFTPVIEVVIAGM